MKHINLVPKSSWWERYQWLLVGTIVLISATGFCLYLVWPYLRLPSSSVISSTSSCSSQAKYAKYSIYKLKMVGYLSQNDQLDSEIKLSILESADGKILTLGVGDHVGSEDAKVVDIRPNMTALSLPHTTHVVRINSAAHD